MFILTPERYVNLKNVSNINIDNNRIIFNMSYNINISSNKQISDYVYWEGDANDLDARIHIIESNSYFNGNFIRKIKGGYININEVSSVKILDKKMRVIFNLSHPVTFKDYQGNLKLTSEFVYVDASHEKEFNQYVNYVKETLGEK